MLLPFTQPVGLSLCQAGRQKPGPKGRMLEPYPREAPLRARSGQSMQTIVNWLADLPRSVSITRQAIHSWVWARIRKLEKFNATFAHTGVVRPFQEHENLWRWAASMQTLFAEPNLNPMLVGSGGPWRSITRCCCEKRRAPEGG